MQDTADEALATEGFLEQNKKKFKFDDAELRRQLPTIDFVEGSIKREELKDLYKFVKKHF